MESADDSQPSQSVDTPELPEPSIMLRYPRDGFDIKLMASQEAGLVLFTKLSAEIKALLANMGVTLMSTDSMTFVPFGADAPAMAHQLTQFRQESGMEIGCAIIGNNVFPYCEVRGQRYRILRIPKSFDQIPLDTLITEINKIFVPSKGIELPSGKYILMPIQDSPMHVDQIAQSELDDFIARLTSSEVVPILDLGMTIDPTTGRQYAESNMMRIEGKLYLSDAGDILNGTWGGDKKTDVIREAQQELALRLPS